jgi:hypothetical protein
MRVNYLRLAGSGGHDSLQDERKDDEDPRTHCRIYDCCCQSADAERPHEGRFAGWNK